MKKEKIIKMLSSAFDEIGRLRVENRRLIEETKELAEKAEKAMKKLDEVHEANAEVYRALQQAEKSKEKTELALKLAHANERKLAGEILDLTKERDAALRRAEKAEDELEMRSEETGVEVSLRDGENSTSSVSSADSLALTLPRRVHTLERGSLDGDALPRNDGEEAALTAAEKNYAPTPLSETVEVISKAGRAGIEKKAWAEWLRKKFEQSLT